MFDLPSFKDWLAWREEVTGSATLSSASPATTTGSVAPYKVRFPVMVRRETGSSKKWRSPKRSDRV